MDYFDTFEWDAKGEYRIGGWGGAYDEWLYRRPITVNNISGGALINYQVLVTLTLANHTYAHSEANGADLRFTQDDGATPLDYWIDEWVEDGTSKVWIEIDSIPTGENLCAYLYCGKSGASGESDIPDTFIDGWDFEGDSIGSIPTGWTEDTAHGSFRVVAGKTARLQHSSGVGPLSNNYAAITAITGNNDRAIHFTINPALSNTYDYIIIHDSSGHADEGIFINFSSAGQIRYTDGSWHNLQAYNANTDYKFKIYNIDLANNQFDIDINGVNKGVNLGFRAAQASLNYFTYEGAGGENADENIDDFFIRKIASTEPTNAVGAEANLSSNCLSTWIDTPIEWDAKGAFETPTISFFDLVEWEAKGGIAITSEGEYKTSVEWEAKSQFKTPKAFVFIDLR
jgi:hypothetical protein